MGFSELVLHEPSDHFLDGLEVLLAVFYHKVRAEAVVYVGLEVRLKSESRHKLLRRRLRQKKRCPFARSLLLVILILYVYDVSFLTQIVFVFLLLYLFLTLFFSFILLVQIF